MGSRANGAVVCDGITTVYYSKYCADLVVDYILGGPNCVLQGIECWEERPEKILMDDVWAEAAVVVNIDRESVAYFDTRLGRNALLLGQLHRLAREKYLDCELHWLSGGMRDFAYEAGLQPDFEEKLKAVNGRELVKKYGRQLLREHFCSVNRTDHIVSITTQCGDTRLYGLRSFRFVDSLEYGPALFELCESLRGKAYLSLTANPLKFPEGGVHIDWRNTTMDYWSSLMSGPEVDAIEEGWKGWKVNWHRDNFEVQLKKTNGIIEMPKYSEAGLIEGLKDLLYGLSDPRRNSDVWET